MKPTQTAYHLLYKKIEHLNHMYHTESISVVDDAVYDSLKRNLVAMEEELGIIDKDSPTQTVGSVVTSTFATVKHITPMLSLQNAFSADDLVQWMKTLPLNALVGIEPKLDGLSVDLVYKDGQLIRGITRGDGYEGEDVTENIRNVWGVQTSLLLPSSGIVEIRGEVLVAKKAFHAINAKLHALGKKTYANPRNYAAGSLRLKDPQEVMTRNLTFVAFDVIHDNIWLPSDFDRLSLLSMLGFRPSSPVHVPIGRDADKIQLVLDEFIDNRASFEWEIDGLVFKIEEEEYRKVLGERGNSPRWAIAYKFPAEEATSTLREVTFQIGKSGVATPVASIDPVFVGGVTVSSVTLHNVAEIERLGIRIGDTVVVVRRGDVIPKIESVLVDLRTGEEHQIQYPEKCPACDTPMTRMTHSLYCPNNLTCPDQSVAKLAHFVSRGGMDIKHLGDAAVEELTRLGLVGSFSSLYYLGDEDLRAVWPTSEVTRKKVLASIEESKSRPFRKVLFAVGISNVGEGTSERLAEHYKSFSDLCQATVKDLEQIPDIGELTATSIYEHCATHYREFIAYDKLFTYVEDEVDSSVERDLEGQRVLVSGTLFTMPDGSMVGRSAMEKHVKSRGAKLASGISNTVDIFYAGAGAGPEKVRKAIALGFELKDGVYTNVNKERT